MKFNHISKALMVLAMGGAMVSCNDLLDQEPQSSITPESYYKAEDQIQACAISRLWLRTLQQRYQYRQPGWYWI